MAPRPYSFKTKLATYIGNFLPFINGWFTNKPVSKPFLILSGFRPSHSLINFCKTLLSFEISIDNSCSVDRARKVAPKIVSGLVVNTLIKFSRFDNLKFISAPIDLPIQFDCITLTLLGQLVKLSKSFKSSSE